MRTSEVGIDVEKRIHSRNAEDKEMTADCPQGSFDSQVLSDGLDFDRKRTQINLK